MDAVHTHFNKIVLFLAAALLLVVPGRAQTFVLGGAGGGSTVSVTLGSQAVAVSVAGSLDNATPTAAPITFGTVTTYGANKPGPNWLAVNNATTALSSLQTPTTLYLSVANSSGMVSGVAYTATVTLNSTLPATGITGTINVSFTIGGSTSGGTLTPSTTSVSLNAAPGASNSVQVDLTNNTGNTVTFGAPTITTTTGANWLTASANIYTVTSGSYAVLTISVPNGLTLATGTYYGTVAITPTGGTSSSISVTFTVGTSSGNGNLSASPNPISWIYNTATPTVYPSSQVVTLTSSTGATNYTAIVSSSSPWLLANGSSSASGYISSGITLSANPSSMSTLSTGSPTGLVYVTDSNGNQITITVNLSVNGSSVSGITWSPNPVTLTAALNGSTVQQTVYLTSTAAGTFTASIANNTGSGLSISTVTTTTSNTAYVLVYGNPTGLATNTYSGTLTAYLAPSAGGATVSQAIPISFAVGSGTTTTTSGLVAPSALTFAYQTNSNNLPPAQNIVVTGTGSYSVATPPTYPSGETPGWLSLSPTSGTAPSTVSVSLLNPNLLAAGTYTATVVVTPYIGATATNVTVTLLVTGSPVLIANPGLLYFPYTSGGATPYSPVYLTASDGSSDNLPVTVATTTSWLSVGTPNQSTTPNVFTAQVGNPSSLANGLYTGTVTVTATGAANSPVSIPVVLTVTGSSAAGGSLTLTPSSMTFNAVQGGAAPAAQTLSVSASTTTNYSAQVTSGTNWLSISATSGTTNSSFTVSVNQSGLTATTYYGIITLAANNVTQQVQVTLVVSSTGTSGNVTVSPTSLSFGTYTIGGSTPAAQTLQVSSASGSAGISFTISSNASWLSTGVANGTSATTSTTFNVSVVNPAVSNLAPGPYTATITITPTGGTVVSVTVSLTVQAAPTVTATPTTLTFTYQVGGANPSTQTVNVSGGGQSLGFTAQATTGSNWLSVSPTSGTTATTGTTPVTVTVNPANLSANTYTGTIVVSATGAATGSTTINVTLTVSAPLPTITGVVNAASSAGGKVSPGEIVSIYGTNLGPATSANGFVDPSTGKLTTTVGGVQVFFNGIPAPIFYVSSTQVNTVVPYEMAPISNPQVWIKYVGQTSNAFQLTSAATAPGLFTQNSSGSGPGAILNQDYSLNGPNNPAAAGSIVQVFMTGEGQTSPQGVTGAITTVSLPPPQVTPGPLLAVGVLINGLPALPVYAGEAPYFVAGLMQLNVQIPSNAQSGILPITVSVGSNMSQSGVTVSVR
jgi:uncharacterized protein (TIGR03437 family)